MKTPQAPPLPPELDVLFRRMRWPYMRRAAPEICATARAQRWDPAEVLRVLFLEEICLNSTAGENSCPSVGNSGGRRWGGFVSVYGDFLLSVDIRLVLGRAESGEGGADRDGSQLRISGVTDGENARLALLLPPSPSQGSYAPMGLMGQ